ncbi:ketopantoate reductase family protein [Rossellomorea oryzaecorticis]|jgi:2-dehydropantoate 2-reductase|uniref:2-dehydropantoate 2-reductase n=1 Tax=Rossellomorea oryzaecorticis TaxID=1396505 RepID=A0ABW8VNG1_9BACI
MKIGIIGGGALGLLFSHYLSEKFDVTLLVRRSEQVQEINRHALTLKRDGHDYHSFFQAERLRGSGMGFNLIIIAVKEYDLGPVLNALVNTDVSVPLLFLQNGIGHIDQVKSLPHETLLAGSVEHGALKENDHSVVHTGKGRTNLAFIRGESTQIEELLIQEIKYFPFSLKDDYEKMILKKLFINVLINPLTSIARIKNGRLAENPHFLHIQHALFNELHILFPHMKDHIRFEEVMDVVKSTSSNRSSMLKDIEERRNTEVETILGALLLKAEKENHFLPIMKTLYELVKGIEREGQGG